MLFKNPKGGERIWKQGDNIKLRIISVFPRIKKARLEIVKKIPSSVHLIFLHPKIQLN